MIHCDVVILLRCTESVHFVMTCVHGVTLDTEHAPTLSLKLPSFILYRHAQATYVSNICTEPEFPMHYVAVSWKKDMNDNE